MWLRKFLAPLPVQRFSTLFSPARRPAGMEGSARTVGDLPISASTASAPLIYEVVATFLFLVCILDVTQRGAPVSLAGLAIGLTLIAIHLFGVNITGTSVNPARSLGPAIVGAGVKPERLAQVWLFI